MANELVRYDGTGIQKLGTRMIEVPDVGQLRLLRLFVIDPDPRLPADSACAHDTGEIWTRLNNEDFLAEVDMRAVLENHNAIRGTVAGPDGRALQSITVSALIKRLVTLVADVGHDGNEFSY